MPAAHASIGGSTIERVMLCPGSVRLCADIPNRSSLAALRGTALHGVMERLAQQVCGAEAFVGRTVTEGDLSYTITQKDIIKGAMPALAAYHRFTSKMEVKQLEVRVAYRKNVWGTADVLAHNMRATGKVGDFKFGTGKVEVEENKQMLFYAGAAIECREMPSEVRTIELAIIQPTHRPVLNVWKTTRKFVDAFVRDVKRAVERAHAPDAELVPGDVQCEWCPAKSKCPAQGVGRFAAVMKARLDRTKNAAA
jgi:hypothetical protein